LLDDVVDVVEQATHPELCDPADPLLDDEVVPERQHPRQLHVVAVRDHRLPVRPTRCVDRGDPQLEVHRPLGVGEHEEPAVVVGDAVLDTLLARFDQGEGARRVAGVEEPGLVGDLRPGAHVEVAVVPAETDRHVEPFVVLTEHEHVAIGVRAELVPPHLEGAHRHVRAHIEEVPGVP